MKKSERYENYKDTPHFDLVKENETVVLPSVFDFKGGFSEIYPFLHVCEVYNCTVIFENEDIIMEPKGDIANKVKLSVYAMLIENPKPFDDYIRYIYKKNKELMVAKEEE